MISLFSGLDESVFQHMKIAFYAYIVLTAIEFILFRKKINDIKKFIYSHLLSTMLIPLIVLILFLVGAMIYDSERSKVVEIIYALTITYLSGLSISIIEQEFKEIEFSKRFKALLFIIIIIMILEFTVFTIRGNPWHDLFANPYGP
jgi:cell shape-determining protein MreD